MKSVHKKLLVKDGLYNSFPSITRAHNGNLITVYRQAENSLKKYGKISHVDPSSRIAMIVSTDEGETWSEPKIIYDDEMGEQDPCVFTLSDGMLICTFFRWKVVPLAEKDQLGPAYAHVGRVVFDTWAAVHVGTMCIRSFDHGESWDGPYPLEPTGFESPMAMRGNIVELPGDRIAAPLYGCEKFGGMSESMLMASDDRGQHWFPLGKPPANGEFHFVEPFLHQAPSGRLDMLMRTHRDYRKYPFDETYCNLYVSSSHDMGVQWTPVRETSLFCPNPVYLLPVDDDQVCVTFGQRRDPKGICGYLTQREEPLFDDALCHYIVPSESGDLGYTSAVQLRDGRVLVVYYITDEEEDACIGAAVVAW